MTRALIVDDSANIRHGVQVVLNRYSEIEIVGDAANGAAAIDKVRATAVDLVLLDLTMPVVDGLTAAEEIKRICPNIKIIVFSMHRISELVETARMLGLDGYAFKEEAASLTKAIEMVLSGQTYFPRA